jgi:putative ABC transport system permease protein
METLWQDLKYGARQLARAPGFTIVAVLTLALGIGANTAIFSVVHAVLLQPLPYSEPDRLLALAEADSSGPFPITTSFGTFQEWKARSSSFERMALHRGWSPTLLTREGPERLQARRVSAEFFSLLRVRPALGRDFQGDEDRPQQWRVVIVSHGLWERRFSADPELIGKTISLNGTAFIVVGVLPQEFRPVFFSDAASPVELWAPLGYAAQDPFACRSCRHLQAVGRLRDGVGLEEARAELNAIERSLVREFPNDFAPDSFVAATPLRDDLVGRVRPVLFLLLGTVGFVLLIGCANVANLLLARAAGRERELAIRSALGAGRVRLLRQLLTESILLALLGGVAGLLLSLWAIELLLAFDPENVPRLENVRLDSPVLLATLLLSVLTGLLVGVVPALQPARLNLSTALKEGGRGTAGAGHARLRGLLVSAEIALACLLVVGAGLLLKSFVLLLDVDPGFEPRNLLTLNTYALGPRYPEMKPVAQFYADAFSRILALPGVEAVGAITPLPLSSGFDRAGFHIEERPVATDAEAPSVDRYIVTGDFLRALGVPLLAGRDFTKEEKATDAGVALISRSVARDFWPSEDPIGKRIKLGGSVDPWRTIIGVVGDVRHYGLHAPPSHQVYLTGAAEPGFGLTLVVRTTTPPARLERAVRGAIWSVDSERPIYAVATMEEIVAASIAQRRFALFLLAAFAGLALLLAVVGVYGAMAYSVAQRSQEIGIRMALGASAREILRLVVGQSLRLILPGVALGLLGAGLLARLLATLLYQVRPTDPTTFAAVSLLLMAVALAACYVPARRATRVDPMTALRYE